MRGRDIFDSSKEKVSITIVGAGSIGSNIALLLARLGMEDITVYDDDSVEDHNLGHQAYRVVDIGRTKVEALADIIKDATSIEIKGINAKATGDEITTDVLILAVDSMAARKEISSKATFTYCVDGRMGGETFNIYAFSTLQKDRYEKTLFDDNEGSELPCGGKSIGYISYLISGMMENVLTKILKTGEAPFEQNFCAKNFIYQTTN